MTENLYAVGQRECWKLGDHYTRNSLAMTAEGLHSKADIAAELGVRDAEIERLRAANAQMLEHGREMWADVERLRPIATAAEAYVKRWKTTQGTCEEGGMLDVWSALFNAVEGAQDEPSAAPSFAEIYRQQSETKQGGTDALNKPSPVHCPAEAHVKAIDKALGQGWVERLVKNLTVGYRAKEEASEVQHCDDCLLHLEGGGTECICPEKGNS